MPSFTVVQVLFHPVLLVAFAVFAIGNIGLAAAELRWLPRFYNNPLTEWIGDHVVLALGRVFLLLLFIAMAYPVLFGIADAPALRDLFAHERTRTTTLVNSLFLLSLVLPALPVIGRLHGLVLPVQAIVAAALVFSWAADAAQVHVSLWPGALVAASIAAWALLSRWLARRIASWLGDTAAARTGTGDLDIVVFEAVVLFFQAPAVLMYTLAIGGRLAA